MGVRRQIYLAEADDRLLEEHSHRTGLSVSELIRRAIHQCYGAGRRLSWDEVLADGVRIGSATGDPWVYDPLFDADLDDELDAELDNQQPTERSR
jgi:hypothetical protein